MKLLHEIAGNLWSEQNTENSNKYLKYCGGITLLEYFKDCEIKLPETSYIVYLSRTVIVKNNGVHWKILEKYLVKNIQFGLIFSKDFRLKSALLYPLTYKMSYVQIHKLLFDCI